MQSAEPRVEPVDLPPADGPRDIPRERGLVERVLSHPVIGLTAALLLLVLLLTVTQERFLTAANLSNLLRTNAVLAVLAVGVTPIVLVGAIDLSPGALLALTAVLYGFLQQAVPDPVAVVAAVAIATLVGAVVNGIPVARWGLEPFVVTLATMVFFRGLANVLTQGQTRVLDGAHVAATLAEGEIGPVPVPLLVVGLVVAATAYVLHRTYLGRDVYAIGGNREAARLAGIRVSRVQVATYAMAGFAAGLAAVLQAGRLASVAPSAGTGLELLAIAAVLLGGTRLGGGRGSVLGTVVGVLFLATIDNGLTITGVSQFFKDVVTGTVLFLAVLFDRVQRHLSTTRRRTPGPGGTGHGV